VQEFYGFPALWVRGLMHEAARRRRSDDYRFSMPCGLSSEEEAYGAIPSARKLFAIDPR
jgi:hypothetical protein